MTHDEAKELLSATRPEDEQLARDGRDGKICAAFDTLRGDAALQGWYSAECALDEVITGRFRAALALPPEGLRDSLIAVMLSSGRPADDLVRAPIEVSRGMPLWSWAAVAAGVLVLGTVGLSLRDGWFSKPTVAKQVAPLVAPNALEFVSFRQSMSDYANGNIKLSKKNEDVVVLTDWVSDHAGPAFGSLPEKMNALTGIGCTVIEWDGQKVSLFCFRSTGSGNVAHLFVIAREAFRNLPLDSALRKPEVCCGLESVAWDDESRVYLLVAHSPDHPVSEFF